MHTGFGLLASAHLSVIVTTLYKVRKHNIRHSHVGLRTMSTGKAKLLWMTSYRGQTWMGPWAGVGIGGMQGI